MPELRSSLEIMAIKRKAGGYRNRERFKTATYFFCGSLDLYQACLSPLAHRKPGRT